MHSALELSAPNPWNEMEGISHKGSNVFLRKIPLGAANQEIQWILLRIIARGSDFVNSAEYPEE
jgi:hypothetical protein